MIKTKDKIFPRVTTTPAFRRNFIWNLIGTTCWSFLSLLLMVIVTHLNDVSDAGMYSFAFSAAIVFMAIGVYSGRTFQVTDKNPKTTDSDYFYLKFLTCGIMFVVALGFSVVRRYDIQKLAIVLVLTFFRLLEAFCESVYAVLQKNNRLDQVGKSFFLKSCFALLLFILIDVFTHNIILACLALVVSSLIIIICYDLPNLRRVNFRLLTPNHHHVLLLLKIGFFVFGFSLLNLYLINAAKYAIDMISENDVQLVYGIIAMPATMLSLFGQYLLQPFLVPLRKACFTDFPKFKSLTYKIVFLIVGFGILCLLTAWIAGIPVLEFVYSLDLKTQLNSFLLIILGGTLATIATVFSASLTIMRQTAVQFILYVIVSLLALGISYPLVASLGIFGGSITYLISMGVLCLLYFVLFIYQCHKFIMHYAEELRHVQAE